MFFEKMEMGRVEIGAKINSKTRSEKNYLMFLALFQAGLTLKFAKTNDPKISFSKKS